jgi:amidase
MQNDLQGALNSSDTKEHRDALKQELRRAARAVLDELFDKENINIPAAPGDSPLCVHAAAADNTLSSVLLAHGFLTGSRYPVATVPIGQIRYNDGAIRFMFGGQGG